MQKITLDYLYNDKKIVYNIWFSDDSHTIETVIFLGTVQIGRLPEWVAEACPPRTAIVEGAPHWHAKDDGSDILEYMRNYTEQAFKGLIGARGVSRLHVITDSQAAPGAILLFLEDKYRRYMKDLVLLQPLGLTKNIFVGNEKQRAELFKKRILMNGYHQLIPLLFDSKLRYNHSLLRRTVSFKDSKAIAQYSSGLAYDALPSLKKLYEFNPNITVICGEKDKIFPPNEVRASLKSTGVPIDVVVVSGAPHPPLATKLGMRMLNKAFEVLGIR